ncbi:SsgA family sporulation/cell division regulator [Streptomyces albipurpureus]|uniref:SsgA family sporulation/cell division regulator n=1 Tax=Streptomyces albipurpureus TaxID=2897419 RepID=A0ABT0UUI4_9ACTN|nr:SsgA family sporulation/cell division regulator [Streptomyces sp. CWNU-1]MCM2392248.1 SsgA family sporulation/cell division regulator [Streptomyces sp. CWNU-1]
MHSMVERELELKLVLSAERSILVPARLTYRTDDPFAVHVTFHIGSENPVKWTFSRELLVEGVFRPCGQGDVRIWPTKVEDRSVILIALSSPDGDALLEASAAVVTAWIERTLRVVPPGTEAAQLGLDDALAELLSPRRADGLWARGHHPAGGKDVPGPSDDSQDGDG